LNFAESASI
jgi:large subunit ribosomal protein L15e